MKLKYLGIALVMVAFALALSGCTGQQVPTPTATPTPAATTSTPVSATTPSPTPTATPIAAPPPSIVQFSPSNFTSDVPMASKTFSIEVNQTSNIIWEINGIEVQSNKNVTNSYYTNASAQEGVWTVAATVSNSNGTGNEVWIWTVRAPTPTLIDADMDILLLIALFLVIVPIGLKLYTKGIRKRMQRKEIILTCAKCGYRGDPSVFNCPKCRSNVWK